MDLTVVIVNYNVQYFLDQCLKSVFRSGNTLEMEVIVVDNNSVDGSQEMIREKYPRVLLIANQENSGFSKANNQAIRIAKGRYVLLLNPDTVVEDDTLTKVVRFMDKHPDAGGLGVKMLDGQGQFLPESKRGLPTPDVAFFKIFGLAKLFPKSRTFGKYHLGYLDPEQTHEVEVLSGAFMLLRKEALEKTGYLDEDFFMYGEDIDLSYRITQAGYKNYYFPETRIIHYKGESTKKSSVNYVLVFYNAMIIFARKHFSKQNAWLFSLLINLAVYFRAGLAIFSRFLKKIFWPLLDALIIYAGFYFIKNSWEEQVFNGPHYPPEFMHFIVPAYILIWLFTVYFSGGYDKPIKIFRIIRGIGMGTVIILVIYALLPISLRFSRALILLGGAWALFSILLSRTVLSLIRKQGLHVESSQNKRIIIVGDGEEAARIVQMIRQAGNSAFIGLVSLAGKKPQAGGYLGTIQQINEIIEIYHIDEIIFCAADMSSQAIIDHMASLSDQKINFKIAPPESLYIIGSNSIETFEELFTININAVNKPANRRNKRLFDLVASGLIFLSLPLTLFIVKNPLGLIRNIFSIILGRKSWVGYHILPKPSKLPKIKRGVLFPGDMIRNKRLDEETRNNLNNLYAKEYRIENDLNILMKGWRNLGRK
ncbi:MAG: glycosyltransferase [Bacteroidales bacterium]|jgi:GT2 family glycosyltransferase|nr:glycosyltransferase [Bacteroidales bacterium]NLM91904.1 glycosyltransferase [Bacteroidales bacterium]